MDTVFDPFVSLGGYYQSLLLYRFFESGLFDLLAKPRTIQFAARRYGWRANELRHCLEFLRSTTGLVDRDRLGRFRVIASHTEMQGLRFQVIKFAGAYGPTAARLDRALESPAKGRELVDRRALASAFHGMKDSTRGWIAPMLLGAGVTSLLDLGCGTASLLIELAKIDSRFHGVGVDGDRNMCKLARGDARAAGVARRVKIICSDGRDLESLPDAGAIHAASLLNEFFAEGSSEAIRFLVQLKARFPGRDCWLVDYYGQLGRAPRRNRSPAVTHGMLHDLVQVLSGQGVPPPDLKSWRAIYRRSGIKLVEAHEFNEHGLTWFIHRVRL